MAFSFKYFEFLKAYQETPEVVIFTFAFGMPLVMLGMAVFTNIYKHLKSAKSINIILYAILTLLWTVGTLSTLVFFFIEKNTVKLFLVAVLVVLMVPLFVIQNYKSILKFYDFEVTPKLNKNKGLT
jgi:membrane protein YdbS with pleckstrin-like domain